MPSKLRQKTCLRQGDQGVQASAVVRTAMTRLRRKARRTIAKRKVRRKLEESDPLNLQPREVRARMASEQTRRMLGRTKGAWKPETTGLTMRAWKIWIALCCRRRQVDSFSTARRSLSQ